MTATAWILVGLGLLPPTVVSGMHDGSPRMVLTQADGPSIGSPIDRPRLLHSEDLTGIVRGLEGRSPSGKGLDMVVPSIGDPKKVVVPPVDRPGPPNTKIFCSEPDENGECVCQHLGKVSRFPKCPM